MCLVKHGCLYYHDMTILMFGFGSNEKKALNEAVNEQMAIFHAENWVDLLAVPYCIGIINFEQLRFEEQSTIIDFFKSYGEMPDTIIYTVNCLMSKEDLPRGFVLCNSIFRNQSTLKANILSALKSQKRIESVVSVERRLH